MNLLVTGANGFVGRHVVKHLKEHKPDVKLFTPTRSELDLRLYPDVCQYISIKEIDCIVHLAARVGGIGANKRFPAKFFYDNMIPSMNLMHAASQFFTVKKFINVGTICSYPRNTPVPFKEEDLWNGYPEDTNAPYGIAKKAVMTYGQCLQSEYNFPVVNLMPVNMIGEHDQFNPIYSHVVPAIILKIDKAVVLNSNKIDLWGTGEATREFLYAGDFAKAIGLAIEKNIDSSPINIGVGKEISIRDLAYKIKDTMGWDGQIEFTGQVSDGQPRRCLDVTKAKEKLGFVAGVSLDEMLRRSIVYYFELKEKESQLIKEYWGMI